ncbi:ubiquitin-specific protease ubp1 [Microbotryomycetes sp. JL201]|nr:ubiquitin-specific protease ubp1 [Microbotryomycetes sp. JL201]
MDSDALWTGTSSDSLALVQPPSLAAILLALTVIALVSFTFVTHSVLGLSLLHPVHAWHAVKDICTHAASPSTLAMTVLGTSAASSSTMLSSPSSNPAYRRTRNPNKAHELARHATGTILYPGLLNAAGNLCFLNATLQSLASLPPLVDYLAQIPHSITPTPVADTLLMTLDALNFGSTRPSPLRPVQLATALANSSKQRRRLLSSSEQQDAHELCTMIREAVDEEVARVEHARAKVSNDGLAQIVHLLGDKCLPETPEIDSIDSSRATDKDCEATVSAIGSEYSEHTFKRESIHFKTARVRNPWRLLTSQRIKCMTCGYTRDVRHIEDEQVPLQVPPVAHCSLYDLLQEHTKIDLLSDYVCRKCSITATLDKLAAQRDRLALTVPPTEARSTVPPASAQVKDSSAKPQAMNGFSILEADASTSSGPSTTPTTTLKTMTSSRKDRKRKVQKVLDKLQAVTAASDFERELSGEGIKVEKVSGPAGKQTKFARTPDILTIHLSRSVHYGRAGAFKNTCSVSFPEYLDLTPFCDYSSSSSASSSPSVSTRSSPGVDHRNPGVSDSTAVESARATSSVSTSTRDMFRLSSLVVHYGSHQFGHYVAFRRAPHSKLFDESTTLETTTTTINQPEWYRISDEVVEPSSVQEVLRANPVLMFYERVKTGQEGQKLLDQLSGPPNRENLGERARVTPRVIERWKLK